MEQHLLTNTLSLHAGIGRQHANVSTRLTTLHMYTSDNFSRVAQEQNRGLLVKQRKNLRQVNSFTSNQICFVSPACLLRRGTVGSVHKSCNFLGIGLTGNT